MKEDISKKRVLVNFRGTLIPMTPEEVDEFFNVENLAEFDN